MEGGEKICILFFTVNGERKGVNDGTKSTGAVEEGRDSDPANNNTKKGAVGAQKNSHEIALIKECDMGNKNNNINIYSLINQIIVFFFSFSCIFL